MLFPLLRHCMCVCVHVHTGLRAHAHAHTHTHKHSGGKEASRSQDEGQMGASCSPDLGLDAQAGNELERCQRQAEEVTEIMLNNFDKVLERDGKLAELEQRSDQLLDMSSAFSKTTKTLAQKKRWENIRCRICLGLVVGFVLLIILIVLLAVFLPQTSKDNSVPQAQDTGIISRPGD
uniref:Vesicle-associated membrane protein 5 n=1 Tax=Equus caballus TaxID=9796 RepID=A0A9L0T5F8_HORSE|nr:PREDICTED: vesicle-associated membrane protein 5 isoform X1 [Equus przewalskii]XP_014586546.1 vesicle-associated membrane protein 5 isoform X1 [Equus caballus]